eukprot:COSAG01_NODE_20372_length_957_cov_2.643357_1_plen_218_part_10
MEDTLRALQAQISRLQAQQDAAPGNTTSSAATAAAAAAAAAAATAAATRGAALQPTAALSPLPGRLSKCKRAELRRLLVERGLPDYDTNILRVAALERWQRTATDTVTIPSPVVYCVTGGPCAAKTTGLNSIAAALREAGFHVILVREAATDLLASCGGHDAGWSPAQFQATLLSAQLASETIAAGGCCWQSTYIYSTSTCTVQIKLLAEYVHLQYEY